MDSPMGAENRVSSKEIPSGSEINIESEEKIF
jgi:hypothetical protein